MKALKTRRQHQNYRQNVSVFSSTTSIRKQLLVQGGWLLWSQNVVGRNMVKRFGWGQLEVWFSESMQVWFLFFGLWPDRSQNSLASDQSKADVVRYIQTWLVEEFLFFGEHWRVASQCLEVLDEVSCS